MQEFNSFQSCKCKEQVNTKKTEQYWNDLAVFNPGYVPVSMLKVCYTFPHLIIIKHLKWNCYCCVTDSKSVLGLVI